MTCEPPQYVEPINQYAVVSYIPGKLGDFITELRQELVSGCTAQSHITILPPRTLDAPPELAEADIQIRSAGFSAFEVEISSIEVFAETSVIYANVTLGKHQFEQMHDVLNTGSLAFAEKYEYHPHVTLAQNFDPDTVGERLELARRIWKEKAPRHTMFWNENMTFVQNTNVNRWLDLMEFELKGALVG